LVVGLVVVVIVVVLVVVVEGGGGGLMKEDVIVIDLICFDAFTCHSVLPDFDIDFFFFFFSTKVGAPLLGLVDIVDRRDVGDVVNICVILVLVGDDDEGIFVRLDIGRDVGDVVAMIVGYVVVVVGGAFVKVVGNDDGTAVSLATQISLLYLAWTRDKHPLSLLLKNPISFQSGRTDMSILSQTYDRTILLILP
jgi:hypothetical protein